MGRLVDCPVIAPRCGLRRGFHGLAALLNMLQQLRSGVTVVNIDNGSAAAMWRH
jgi:NCAIR mutase (PurE)-related protein